jgi:hypothetical protein
VIPFADAFAIIVVTADTSPAVIENDAPGEPAGMVIAALCTGFELNQPA